jgi:hypothetical protein
MGIGAKENGNLCHHQEGENRETTEDQRHLNGKKTCGPQLSSPLSLPPLKKATG